jgi:uncharacterized protein YjbJ (UPF0337 family)
MGERIDELKGTVKKGLGTLTGNTRLEAEGTMQTGVARAKRKTKGALREAGGAVREGLGKLTGNLATQARGTAGKLRGKAERTG